MRNGIKQLLRTPIKTGLLFLLLSFSAVLFTIGTNLWIQVSKRLNAADDLFITIGTVTQKEDGLSSASQWDAALNNYIYFDTPVYSKLLTTDILEKLSIEFISKPEQRPYYGAMSYDFVASRPEDRTYGIQTFIGEISPLEDCIPDKPVRVKVEKTLWGEEQFTGKTIFFCDHTSKFTNQMKKGKVYLAYLGINPFNSTLHTELDDAFEYMPVKLYQEQSHLWYEISDGFYETEEGGIWKKIITYIEGKWDTAPVTPTSDLQLINAFHDGEAVIMDGRTINEEEFSAGKEVCLISQDFAKLNHIKVGDSFELQFYFIDYKNPVGQIAYTSGGVDVTPLKSNGEPYDVFQTTEYKVVGIYSYPVTLTDNQYALGANQIFIPSKSVKENEQNILEDGPMQGFNTSFRIRNGSIDQFMEKMNEIPENEYLRFQFYDNGYEQLVFGLQGTKLIAVVLFFAGLALLIGIIVFILYVMVIKQKRRIAIERALGTSKVHCMTSLLSGILFLTISSLVIGVVTGDALATKMQSIAVSGIEQFDNDYTIGIDTNSIDEVNLEINNNTIIIYEVLTIAGGTIFIIALSFYLILRNYREAPINLLGRRDD